MRRREFFIALLTATAAAGPSTPRAQPSASRPRIGVLMGFPESDARGQAYVLAMRTKLESLGWVEGRNITIDYRWAGGDREKARTFAKELIGMAPRVIVTSTNQVTETVRQETQTIPIVFASLGDPVGSGLVASPAKPGGNVTGFPVFVDSMGSKWLELLREIAPRVERAGFLFHPDAVPNVGLLRAAQSAAPPMKLKLVPLAVRDAAEIKSAISAFAAEGDRGGLVVATHAVTLSNRDIIIGLAASNHLPTVFGDLVFAESGGLLSYGSDIGALFEGAASYVDRILKGAKPADLPVQLPTKFDLVINLKTARELGLNVPARLLVGVSRVIE
ncbi:MAG: ABC transporter substrate-binding protein [Burkholderiales bacterium]